MSYTELAQKFIHLVVTAKRAGDISKGLNQGLNALVNELRLERAIIWQVCGDCLTSTHVASANSVPSSRSKFTAEESVLFVLGFLSRTADTQPVTAWAVEKTESDSAWKMYIDSFEGISSILLAEIRCDIFSGFLALHSMEAREWTADERKTIEGIAEFLSVLFVMNHEMQKAQFAAKGNA